MIKKITKNINTAIEVINTVEKVVTTTQKVITVINSSSNSNTLDMVEKVKNVIKVISESDIKYLSNQPKANLNGILSAMTSLMNENDMKIEMLESQPWYQRMIKTVIGKNSTTKDEIRKNHENLNMYMSQAVAHLYDRNCIDNRMIISLSNQLNSLYEKHIQLYQEHNELKVMLGSFVEKLNEKIESVDNFHILNTEICQGVYSNYSSVEAILSILSQLDYRTLMDTRKMAIIQRSIREYDIINDEKISLSDFLIEVKQISYNNVGIIYMDQSNTRGNFISNLILNIFDNQAMLLGYESSSDYDSVLIKELIKNERIDEDIQLSISEIYNELVQAKTDKMNGLSPISKFQYKEMMKEAEEAYLQYNMDYAKNIFTILAEKNVKRAMYFLGELYAYGYGNVIQDKEKSTYWRRKGYENRDILSYLNYAISLNNESEKNDIFTEIFESVLELAKEGDVFAQSEVADMYRYGYGTKIDLGEYIYWISKACDNGYFRAISKLAYCYYTGYGVDKDENKAYVLHKKAATIGEANSQNFIGNSYYNGEFQNQNYEEAVRWYKKSANQGNNLAQSSLAKCYRDGLGVKQDYNEVFRLNLEAANGGVAFAQYQLGYCYMNGLGTKIKYSEGVKWYEKSAENGNISAMLALGDYYSSGIFKIKSEAFKFYKKAAELGSPRGQKELGNCFIDGIGTKVCYVEAVRWYKKSAEQNFAPAMTNLGHCYLKGKGVEKDENMGIYWYNKGAENGSSVSQCILGDCYYRGYLVKKDIEKAKLWYIKSAQGGNKDAKKALKKYYKIKSGY